MLEMHQLIQSVLASHTQIYKAHGLPTNLKFETLINTGTGSPHMCTCVHYQYRLEAGPFLVTGREAITRKTAVYQYSQY